MKITGTIAGFEVDLTISDATEYSYEVPPQTVKEILDASEWAGEPVPEYNPCECPACDVGD